MNSSTRSIHQTLKRRLLISVNINMNFTDSRSCLVDHEHISAGFDSEGSEGAYSVESDWESCSSHSSGAPSSPETCDRLCPSPSLQSLPQHHHQYHHRQQQSAAEPEEEVMFYHSTQALWDSLAYITNMTEMCDVVFHVGQTRQPVYGVKCLLSVRSRVMYLRILQSQRSTAATHRSSWKKLLHSGDTDVTSGGRVSIDVRDYDVRVFSQLIGFLHSGRVKVDISTALGLYCAATEYEVPDLRTACWDFVERCVQRGHAHMLVTSGKAYLGRKQLQKLSRKLLTP